LFGSLAVAAPATAGPAFGHHPSACNGVSADPAIRSFDSRDAWRYASAWAFPFNGFTPHGRGRVIWQPIRGATKGRTAYPKPNLPTCRVGRRGTEDRGVHKGGRYFAMLQPIDGQTVYPLTDSFDRPVATLSWSATSPPGYKRSEWGWFVNGRWAGHDARRAFEVQSYACKLVAAPVSTTYQWVRDPGQVMIAFNPALGSPGRGAAPRSTVKLRLRAFVDSRAVPQRELAYAAKYDFGCGASTLTPLRKDEKFTLPQFNSRYGRHRRYMRDYYFGELASRFGMLPGQAPVSNHHPLDTYNPRSHFHHAAYAMMSSTAVAGGGTVRGIARSGVDRFRLFDEMRYCDPNYTLRSVRLQRGRRKMKLSRFFAPATFSRRNRPAVRWVFGRIDPGPSTLNAAQREASENPASQRLYAWLPVRCKRR
jgi:hypothetical protein